ncbi:Ca-activated chloride channel family protein [Conyzicola nivalis]|uniref:Ca-activated chloride channel family protein n=1 Tax=Conyzicola nivalis TaxID=1477021 RepID=A0ABV2QIJ1_9MICO
MELIFWWTIPVWAALIVVVALLLRRRRAERAAVSLPIAHRDRLTSLPGYARALGRYRRLLVLIVASLALVLFGAVALTARPASVASVQPELKNRDIVLCLDISGSMVDYDKEVLDVFGELAQQFTGERISLVVFNASAVTRFPLTSDYDYISKQLAELREQFDSTDSDYYRGTLYGNGSSLVGDGLASCAVRFDSPDQERSRSVILVTDNLIAGKPVFTLPEAGELARSRGVRVYGINPGDTEAKAYLAELATEFRTVVDGTGGAYYALDDPATIPSIVDDITAQQAASMTGEPELVLVDQPAFGVLLAFVGLAGFFGLVWRLRR